jgi:hypothetical protein
MEHIEQLELVLPDLTVTADMHWEEAPKTCAAISGMLRQGPITDKTYHAIYSGHEFYVYCPAVDLALENHVVYPQPGQLIYYYLPARTYASMDVHRERIGDRDGAEIAIWYGSGDLRIVTETGIRGNHFATVRPEHLQAFYQAGLKTLHEGQKQLTIRPATVGNPPSQAQQEPARG